MNSNAQGLMPEIKMVPLESIHKNPNNPRIIKDDKFKKLCQSIKEDPWFMRLRPIIYDETGMILGGNMRYEACKFLDLKEVPAISANDLTEKQKRRFIIKDNVPGGEWDWDVLTNEWDVSELEEWGLDCVKPLDYSYKNTEIDIDDFSDKMTLKIELTEDNYHEAVNKLKGISESMEDALMELVRA